MDSNRDPFAEEDEDVEAVVALSDVVVDSGGLVDHTDTQRALGYPIGGTGAALHMVKNATGDGDAGSRPHAAFSASTQTRLPAPTISIQEGGSLDQIDKHSAASHSRPHSNLNPHQHQHPTTAHEGVRASIGASKKSHEASQDSLGSAGSHKSLNGSGRQVVIGGASGEKHAASAASGSRKGHGGVPHGHPQPAFVEEGGSVSLGIDSTTGASNQSTARALGVGRSTTVNDHHGLRPVTTRGRRLSLSADDLTSGTSSSGAKGGSKLSGGATGHVVGTKDIPRGLNDELKSSQSSLTQKGARNGKGDHGGGSRLGESAADGGNVSGSHNSLLGLGRGINRQNSRNKSSNRLLMATAAASGSLSAASAEGGFEDVMSRITSKHSLRRITPNNKWDRDLAIQTIVQTPPVGASASDQTHRLVSKFSMRRVHPANTDVDPMSQPSPQTLAQQSHQHHLELHAETHSPLARVNSKRQAHAEGDRHFIPLSTDSPTTSRSGLPGQLGTHGSGHGTFRVSGAPGAISTAASSAASVAAPATVSPTAAGTNAAALHSALGRPPISPTVTSGFMLSHTGLATEMHDDVLPAGHGASVGPFGAGIGSELAHRTALVENTKGRPQPPPATAFNMTSEMPGQGAPSSSAVSGHGNASNHHAIQITQEPPSISVVVHLDAPSEESPAPRDSTASNASNLYSARSGADRESIGLQKRPSLKGESFRMLRRQSGNGSNRLLSGTGDLSVSLSASSVASSLHGRGGQLLDVNTVDNAKNQAVSAINQMLKQEVMLLSPLVETRRLYSVSSLLGVNIGRSTQDMADSEAYDQVSDMESSMQRSSIKAQLIPGMTVSQSLDDSTPNMSSRTTEDEDMQTQAQNLQEGLDQSQTEKQQQQQQQTDENQMLPAVQVQVEVAVQVEVQVDDQVDQEQQLLQSSHSSQTTTPSISVPDPGVATGSRRSSIALSRAVTKRESFAKTRQPSFPASLSMDQSRRGSVALSPEGASGRRGSGVPATGASLDRRKSKQTRGIAVIAVPKGPQSYVDPSILEAEACMRAWDRLKNEMVARTGHKSTRKFRSIVNVVEVLQGLRELGLDLALINRVEKSTLKTVIAIFKWRARAAEKRKIRNEPIRKVVMSIEQRLNTEIPHALHLDLFADAIPILLKSKKMYEKLLGPHHPNTLGAAKQLAHLFSKSRYQGVTLVDLHDTDTGQMIGPQSPGGPRRRSSMIATVTSLVTRSVSRQFSLGDIEEGRNEPFSMYEDDEEVILEDEEPPEDQSDRRASRAMRDSYHGTAPMAAYIVAIDGEASTSSSIINRSNPDRRSSPNHSSNGRKHEQETYAGETDVRGSNQAHADRDEAGTSSSRNSTSSSSNGKEPPWLQARDEDEMGTRQTVHAPDSAPTQHRHGPDALPAAHKHALPPLPTAAQQPLHAATASPASIPPIVHRYHGPSASSDPSVQHHHSAIVEIQNDEPKD